MVIVVADGVAVTVWVLEVKVPPVTEVTAGQLTHGHCAECAFGT